MSWIHSLRGRRRGPTSGRARRRERPLTVEVLENRWCLSTNPYAYVSSYATDSIMRYDEITGAPAPAAGQTGANFIPRGSSPLSSPLFALYTPSGDLIVDSAEDNRIYRYDGQTGAFLDEFIDFGAGGLSHPTGMIFSPNGQYFYVLSSFNNLIIRFDYDGTHGINPVTLVSDPSMGIPVGAVFGPDGNLYVSTLTSNAVLRYDPITGAPLPGPNQSGANFITPSDGGLNMAGGIVFGPDGNLYVANQVPSDILRFDGTTGAALPADGQSGATFVPSGQLNDPAGMLFGPDSSNPCQQDLYVVSINSNSVEQFDGGSGAYVRDFVTAGSGGLNRPRALTFGTTDPATLNYTPDFDYQPYCGPIFPGSPRPSPSGHPGGGLFGTVLEPHAARPGTEIVIPLQTGTASTGMALGVASFNSAAPAQGSPLTTLFPAVSERKLEGNAPEPLALVGLAFLEQDGSLLI